MGSTDGSGPTTTDTDPGAGHIHLLMRSGGNRDLLASWLADTHEVTSAEGPTDVVGESDLCILDESTYRSSHEFVQGHRTRVEPSMYPVLLVRSTTSSQTLPPAVWETVDDVVQAPVRQAELRARIENLLHQRRLTTRLAAKERALSATVDDLRLLERAADAARNGITIVEATDPRHRVVYTNAGFEALTGYDEDELAETGLESLLDPDQSGRLARLEAQVASGRTASETLITERRDGTRFWNRVYMDPVYDDAGVLAYFVSSHTDVTEETVREQRLAVLNRVLRHNLRNDLNVVLGYAALLAEQIPDSADQHALDEIERSATKLDQLGRQAGRIERILERFSQDDASADLAALLEERCADYRTQYPEAEITLSLDECSWAVPTNGLEAALDELVDNAVVHSEHDHPSVAISVTRHEEAPGRVLIRVEDDGPGIPAGLRSVIKHGEETPLEHGDGLGLWLVHWVTTLLGGDVGFEITDAGTRATMTLPVADDPPSVA